MKYIYLIMGVLLFLSACSTAVTNNGTDTIKEFRTLERQGDYDVASKYVLNSKDYLSVAPLMSDIKITVIDCHQVAVKDNRQIFECTQIQNDTAHDYVSTYKINYTLVDNKISLI